MLHHLRLLNLVHPGRKRKNNSSRQKKTCSTSAGFFLCLGYLFPELGHYLGTDSGGGITAVMVKILHGNHTGEIREK